MKVPLGLHIASAANDLAPYFVEEVRQYLEHTYGTAAVHEQGLRVYTSLNVAMQKAADQASGTDCMPMTGGMAGAAICRIFC